MIYFFFATEMHFFALLASACSPCGGGAGLGRDRLQADPMVLWRVLGRAQARLGRRRPEAGDSGQSREEPRNAGTRTAGDQGPAGQDAGRTGQKWPSGGARPRQGPGTRDWELTHMARI
jgi:hypothetical protein